MSEVSDTVWLWCFPSLRFLPAFPAIRHRAIARTVPTHMDADFLFLETGVEPDTRHLSVMHRRLDPALTSDREELLSQPFPTLRGLEPAPTRLPGACDLPFPAVRWKPASDPLNPRRRTAAGSRHFSLSAFPKIAPSSLPNRRVHSRPGVIDLRRCLPSFAS